MKKILVNASKKYEVIVEKGAIDRVGEYIKELGISGKALIVSDSNVAPLYMERVKTSLEKNGLNVFEFVFPALSDNVFIHK